VAAPLHRPPVQVPKTHDSTLRDSRVLLPTGVPYLNGRLPVCFTTLPPSPVPYCPTPGLASLPDAPHFRRGPTPVPFSHIHDSWPSFLSNEGSVPPIFPPRCSFESCSPCRPSTLDNLISPALNTSPLQDVSFFGLLPLSAFNLPPPLHPCQSTSSMVFCFLQG